MYPYLNKFFSQSISVASRKHGVKVEPEPRDPGPRTSPLSQSLEVGPGTLLKCKNRTPGPPSKFKSGTPGLPSKFKSGTLIITYLHCLTYFVLDKYIYIYVSE